MPVPANPSDQAAAGIGAAALAIWDSLRTFSGTLATTIVMAAVSAVVGYALNLWLQDKPSVAPPLTAAETPPASTPAPASQQREVPESPPVSVSTPSPEMAASQPETPVVPAPSKAKELPVKEAVMPKRAKEEIAADILSLGYGDDLWREFCALPASERRSLSESADPVSMLAFYRQRRTLMEVRAFRCTIVSNAGQQKPVTKQLTDEEMCWEMRCPGEPVR